MQNLPLMVIVPRIFDWAYLRRVRRNNWNNFVRRKKLAGAEKRRGFRYMLSVVHLIH